MVARKFQQFASACRTGVERFNRMGEVVDRARERRQVHYGIDRPAYFHGLANILFNKFKARERKQMLDVRPVAGDEIVEGDNLVALLDQAIAEV